MANSRAQHSAMLQVIAPVERTPVPGVEVGVKIRKFVIRGLCEPPPPHGPRSVLSA